MQVKERVLKDTFLKFHDVAMGSLIPVHQYDLVAKVAFAGFINEAFIIVHQGIREHQGNP